MATVKWAVVIPTNRPDKFKEFIEAWGPLFEKHRVHLVVVQDNDGHFDDIVDSLQDVEYTFRLLHWADVQARYIPRKTDMVRSWGFYYVWKEKLSEYILTLDDDVTPIGDPFEEYEEVFNEGAVVSDYFSVGALTSSGLEMRGFPYKDRKKQLVAVQYGGWSGVLDYDAATQLAVPKDRQAFLPYNVPVPKGAAVTCCIMNCAFRTAVTPIMWQLPMLEGRYNRVGDIWSGLFIKRTLDASNLAMVVNGKAQVLHDRASDPYNSLEKEAPSTWLNDHLWENLPSGSYRDVTDAAAKFFAEKDVQYANHFMEARDEWLNLFGQK